MLGRMLFEQGPLPLLKTALGAASLRQKVAASNLANIQTPGFQPRRVVFEELLQKASHASRTSMSRAGGRIAGRDGSGRSAVPGPRIVADEGPLDLERQLVDLQEATLHFEAMSQFVAGHYRALMDAIGPIR